MTGRDGILEIVHYFDLQCEHSGQLFAVVDSARNSSIRELLESSEVTSQSLYEGVDAEDLDLVAPFLIEFDAKGDWFREYLTQAWGQSWGVFFIARNGFQQVRHHLRQFLIVKDEDQKKYYFRFYDPRVLRRFLPTSTSQQLAAFFGSIQCVFTESEAGDKLLQFSCQNGILLTADYPLSQKGGTC
jgi:hypothetical protein